MNLNNFEGGLYLHIPFCKKACKYCNFHFTTSLAHKPNLLAALSQEIALRGKLFSTKKLQTIYFGGGTPSLLNADEINHLFEIIGENYDLSEVTEITMEANPDDLTETYLIALKDTPINRLSIGVQSFHADDLAWMGRAHDVRQAMECIPNAYKYGFENLSVDLIFGYELLTNDKLKYNLDLLNNWKVKHVSAYSLTVEDKTPLLKSVKLGLDKMPDSEHAADQFIMISEFLGKYGYEHYEISNYSLPDFNAVHNGNYWKGIPYIGIGPSAHSFYDSKRYWNVANNAQYIKSIESRILPQTEEIIDEKTAYNELILTRLRTKWGVSLSDVSKIDPLYVEHFLTRSHPFITSGDIILHNDIYTLSLNGKLVADHITGELFL